MWASANRAHLHPRFGRSPGKHQPTTVVGWHSWPRALLALLILLEKLFSFGRWIARRLGALLSSQRECGLLFLKMA
jgi:hypothetical protein